jgi:hypothetical protein
MSDKQPMMCSCGEIAFVCEIVNNPRPENPTPCRAHYLEIVEIRKKQILETMENGEHPE